MPRKKRAFISFDYDHDADLKQLLVGQSRRTDSPFEIADWSLKEAVPADWQREARRRIRATDLMIVICGRHTDTASGVADELSIALEEKASYFLLCGRSTGPVRKPRTARSADKVYTWTWENLTRLIHGDR